MDFEAPCFGEGLGAVESCSSASFRAQSLTILLGIGIQLEKLAKALSSPGITETAAGGVSVV